MEATAELLVLHEPPGDVADKVTELYIQTWVAPEIPTTFTVAVV
jgi:hypothetical protein